MSTFQLSSSVYIDKKYVGLISPSLDRFSWIKSNVACCRCMICGDSDKHKSKRRMYFVERSGKYQVYCHNCHYSGALSWFLKNHFPSYYREYLLERFKGSSTKSEDEHKTPESLHDFSPKFLEVPEILESCCEPLSALDSQSSEVYAYCEKRRIPKAHFRHLYATNDFSIVGTRVDPSNVNLPHDSRLVIPFFDLQGKVFAIQGRSINKHEKLRYITLKVAGNECQKIYGLERCDFNSRVRIFEGPIDSLFIENSLALAGATNLDLKSLPFQLSNAVFVYDNEPRNPEIVDIMHSTIEQGCNVCIWPDDIHEKDVNDMVLGGLNAKSVQSIIDENTYCGLRAKLKLSDWKKTR